MSGPFNKHFQHKHPHLCGTTKQNSGCFLLDLFPHASQIEIWLISSGHWHSSILLGINIGTHTCWLTKFFMCWLPKHLQPAGASHTVLWHSPNLLAPMFHN